MYVLPVPGLPFPLDTRPTRFSLMVDIFFGFLLVLNLGMILAGDYTPIILFPVTQPA